jgi:hypothetical protein
LRVIGDGFSSVNRTRNWKRARSKAYRKRFTP